MDESKPPKSLSDTLKALAESTRAFQDLGALEPPSLQLRNLPTLRPPSAKEQNQYQSAAVMLKRLAETIQEWRAKLPTDHQPAVLAVLHGGVIVSVESLAQESFHGIRVQGTYDGKPCILLAHQTSLQILCFAQPVTKEEFRRKIGFVIDGEESAA